MADKGSKSSSTAKKPLDPKVKDLESKDDVKGGRFAMKGGGGKETIKNPLGKHGKAGKQANKAAF